MLSILLALYPVPQNVSRHMHFSLNVALSDNGECVVAGCLGMCGSKGVASGN